MLLALAHQRGEALPVLRSRRHPPLDEVLDHGHGPLPRGGVQRRVAALVGLGGVRPGLDQLLHQADVILRRVGGVVGEGGGGEGGDLWPYTKAHNTRLSSWLRPPTRARKSTLDFRFFEAAAPSPGSYVCGEKACAHVIVYWSGDRASSRTYQCDRTYRNPRTPLCHVIQAMIT